MNYPAIRDVPFRERGDARHVEIRVFWAEGQEPKTFCGDNWCTGKCGLPALVISAEPCDGDGLFWKASGSQVACGPVMQSMRVQWDGEKVEVPDVHRARFQRLLWW